MDVFSCKNRLFAHYDTGGNEFCTVYAAGTGIRCFFPFYLERLSFCQSTWRLSIGFLIGMKLYQIMIIHPESSECPEYMWTQ